MLTTLACTVFIASIIVFFSEELRKSGRGILKNRKFQVLAPLFLISWIVIHHEWAVLMFVVSCRISLYYIVYGLAKILPWTSGPNLLIPRMVTLFFVPALLLGLIDLSVWWIKPKQNVRHVALEASAFLWAIAAFLLMITLSEYFF